MMAMGSKVTESANRILGLTLLYGIYTYLTAAPAEAEETAAVRRPISAG